MSFRYTQHSGRYSNRSPGSTRSQPDSDEVLTTKIKGVSFEGRQEFVAALEPGQLLVLLPEPSNPHDDDAVAVFSLPEGNKLGYIPREVNAEFAHKCANIARVVSTGYAAGTNPPLLGVQISCNPKRLLVLPMPVPSNWLQQLLTQFAEIPAHYRALIGPEQTQGVCQITRRASKSLQAVPLWQVDVEGQTIKFVRCMMVCADAATAMRVFDYEVKESKHQMEARTKALEILQDLNGWTWSEVWDYYVWGFTLKQHMQDKRRGWRVELLEEPTACYSPPVKTPVFHTGIAYVYDSPRSQGFSTPQKHAERPMGYSGSAIQMSDLH